MGRYFARGTSKWFFAPAVSSPSAPSKSEITDAVELTEEIADISGWDFQQQPIATPDLSTVFDSQIGGPNTVGNPQLDLYDLDDDPTIREALAFGEEGFIIKMPHGYVNAARCEVWPVVVTALNDLNTMQADAAKYRVNFAVTAEPTLDAVCPDPSS